MDENAAAFSRRWQDWCDDMTGVLRSYGFHRDLETDEIAEPPAAPGAAPEVMRHFYGGIGADSLRKRALRLSDESAEAGLVGRDFRQTFYGPRTPTDLWAIVADVARRFIHDAV